jgi:hypothetical protein
VARAWPSSLVSPRFLAPIWGPGGGWAQAYVLASAPSLALTAVWAQQGSLPTAPTSLHPIVRPQVLESGSALWRQQSCLSYAPYIDLPEKINSSNMSALKWRYNKLPCH